ncbi:MAG: efflux RND transporter permease subunit [Romboutsia sp.]|uniref:efflux RND transporter permease subunit n=1 Tax=Romboutsia sp. TaxID=1965302 RepID=UPI003F39DEDB
MIPKFSVKNPYTVAVGVIMVIILGIVSFMNMTTDLLPSVDLPYVMVNTIYPGASPEKVEASVTKPLEQVLATTSGLENISSVSSENSSMVILEFNQKVNMDSAMIDISGKIDMVKGQFDDTVNAPMIMKMNPDMMPIMMLSIDMESMNIKEVTKYVNENILPQFERIEGVAAVEVIGLVEDQLKVSLDKDKIDNVNKKILANIDSEFNKQEKALDDSKEEISKSKATLEKESKTQKANLEKASAELKTAKKQLETAVNAIGLSKAELLDNIDKANIALSQNKEQIDVLKVSLDKLPPEGSEEAFATINAQIKALEEMGSKINQGIVSAKKGIEAIDGLEEIKKKEKELESGKATLEKELGSASSRLTQGENELKQAEEQLKDAKTQAKKGANIKDKITNDMIGNILMAENFSMPAGYIKEDEVEYSVKVGDKFNSVKELENLLLFNVDVEGVGAIRVKDVASVEFTDDSDEAYTNINGNDGIMLTFQKSSNYSTANVTKSINKTIEELSAMNKDIHITTLMDQGVYIDMIIDSVLSNLIYGGVLAVIVLLVFLRSFKTTLVVAFSIPISVLFALVLMYFSGITLNIISLSGLALGVGMLVDNSIVVIENTYRLRNRGMSMAKAAVYGAKQVSGAIFASTLTTICVFLPIVFTDGITKQLFVDMGLTIAYSLIASLIVALTVVPAMSSNLLTKVDEKPHTLFDKFVDGYELILRKSLDHKWVVIVFSLVLLGFSGYKTLSMGTNFMPSMDSTQMTATMTMPKNSKRSETIARSDEFIDKILTIEDVETIGAMEGNMMGQSGEAMSFYIILKEDKKLSNREVEDIIYEKTKAMKCDIKISSSTMDMSALGGSGIQIVVKGIELDVLQDTANDIASILEKVEGTVDVSNGMEDIAEETRIIVNKNKAMEYGLTVAQVYQNVSTALQTEKESTKFTIDNNEYPVIVASDNSITRKNILDYKMKATKDNEEVEIKLDDIADLESAESLSAINRNNQSRYITVSAGIDSKHNIGLVSRDVEDALKDYKAPNGYTIELKGENETINKSLTDLVLMGALAIVFVYLIMVAQFQSLLSPFIVMFTIPLAFTGGLLALIITGNEISVISMLGFLVLSGVVVNNGIVFVDYINQLRLSGKNKKDAIIETGRTRIRPILMTALTTVLAMSTMAIGVGMGAEMTQGLAIVTIGGLIYGTILTLVVIPILYDLLHRKEMKPIIVEEE